MLVDWKSMKVVCQEDHLFITEICNALQIKRTGLPSTEINISKWHPFLL
jgi:hypothetical protein